MTPVLTRHRPEPVHTVRRIAVPIALALALVAVFAALLDLVAPADRVDRLRVENRSASQVEVGVAADDADGILWLAGIEPGTIGTVDEVLDQGERWTFRIERAGGVAGERTLSRADLERRDWRVVIPATFGEHAPDGA